MFLKLIQKTNINDIKITGTYSYIDIQICGRTARIPGSMGIRCFNCSKGALENWLIPENEPITPEEKSLIIQKIKEKTNKSYMVINFDEEDSKVVETPVQQIEKFFIRNLKTKFSNEKIKKIFFEIGMFWNEEEEECIDLHMIVVSEEEYYKILNLNTQVYGKSKAIKLGNQSGEYVTEDYRNCISFPQYDFIRNNFKNYKEAVKMAKQVIKEFKRENLADFNLSEDFKIYNLYEYEEKEKGPSLLDGMQ